MAFSTWNRAPELICRDEPQAPEARWHRHSPTSASPTLLRTRSSTPPKEVIRKKSLLSPRASYKKDGSYMMIEDEHDQPEEDLEQSTGATSSSHSVVTDDSTDTADSQAGVPTGVDMKRHARSSSMGTAFLRSKIGISEPVVVLPREVLKAAAWAPLQLPPGRLDRTASLSPRGGGLGLDWPLEQGAQARGRGSVERQTYVHQDVEPRKQEVSPQVRHLGGRRPSLLRVNSARYGGLEETSPGEAVTHRQQGAARLQCPVAGQRGDTTSPRSVLRGQLGHAGAEHCKPLSTARGSNEAEKAVADESDAFSSDSSTSPVSLAAQRLQNADGGEAVPHEPASLDHLCKKVARLEKDLALARDWNQKLEVELKLQADQADASLMRQAMVEQRLIVLEAEAQLLRREAAEAKEAAASARAERDAIHASNEAFERESRNLKRTLSTLSDDREGLGRMLSASRREEARLTKVLALTASAKESVKDQAAVAEAERDYLGRQLAETQEMCRRLMERLQARMAGGRLPAAELAAELPAAGTGQADLAGGDASVAPGVRGVDAELAAASLQVVEPRKQETEPGEGPGDAHERWGGPAASSAHRLPVAAAEGAARPGPQEQGTWLEAERGADVAQRSRALAAEVARGPSRGQGWGTGQRTVGASPQERNSVQEQEAGSSSWLDGTSKEGASHVAPPSRPLQVVALTAGVNVPLQANGEELVSEHGQRVAWSGPFSDTCPPLSGRDKDCHEGHDAVSYVGDAPGGARKHASGGSVLPSCNKSWNGIGDE